MNPLDSDKTLMGPLTPQSTFLNYKCREAKGESTNSVHCMGFDGYVGIVHNCPGLGFRVQGFSTLKPPKLLLWGAGQQKFRVVTLRFGRC